MNVKQLTWKEAVNWLILQPDHKDPVKACYYDRPFQIAADRYWCSEEWQEIWTFLPSTTGQVLDIGAGNGISSYVFAQDGWQVTPLEPDPSHIIGVGAIRQLAQNNDLAIEVVQEFGERLPFPDMSFNVVFARQVMHHAKDLYQLCREIDRVLKLGGKLITVRDHVISSKKDLPKFFEIHPLHKLYGGDNAFLLKEYTSALQSTGLKLDHILQPFDSPINYGPRSKNELKADIQAKIGKIPLAKIPAKILSNDYLFDVFIKLLSNLDNRPGRLYSFIAHKPNEGFL